MKDCLGSEPILCNARPLEGIGLRRENSATAVAVEVVGKEKVSAAIEASVVTDC